MIFKPLFKKTVEIICKKNCACACDQMIYRIAKEQNNDPNKELNKFIVYPLSSK